MKQVLIISPTSCENFTAFGSLLSLLLGLEVTTTMHGSFLSGSLIFQFLIGVSLVSRVFSNGTEEIGFPWHVFGVSRGI
jgi:hypothetical protein